MSNSKSKDVVPKEIKKYGGRKSRKLKQNIKTERRVRKSRDRYTIKTIKRRKTINGGKSTHNPNVNHTLKTMPISDLERAMLEEEQRRAMLEEQQRQQAIRLDEPITQVGLNGIRAQQQDINNFFIGM